MNKVIEKIVVQIKSQWILVVGIILAITLILLLTNNKSTTPTDNSINGISNAMIAEDLTAVKTTLATKSKWAIDKMEINVLQNTGDHARGGVTFIDSKCSAGGYWFAVKNTDGTWRIVLDGNGQISCAKMHQEGFPEAMIPDCA